MAVIYSEILNNFSFELLFDLETQENTSGCDDLQLNSFSGISNDIELSISGTDNIVGILSTFDLQFIKGECLDFVYVSTHGQTSTPELNLFGEIPTQLIEFGINIEFEIITQIQFNLNFEFGIIADIQLKTIPVAQLEPLVEFGLELQLEVFKPIEFDNIQSEFGLEILSANITLNPPDELEPFVEFGINSIPFVTTSPIFNFDISEFGIIHQNEISVFPPAELEPFFDFGFENTTFVDTFPIFTNVSIEVGSELIFNITLNPPDEFDEIEFQFGFENTTFVDTFPIFTNVSIEVGTESPLDLSTFPFASFVLSSEFGINVDVLIQTSAVFNLLSEFGIELLPDLTIAEAKSIEFSSGFGIDLLTQVFLDQIFIGNVSSSFGIVGEVDEFEQGITPLFDSIVFDFGIESEHILVDSLLFVSEFSIELDLFEIVENTDFQYRSHFAQISDITLSTLQVLPFADVKVGSTLDTEIQFEKAIYPFFDFGINTVFEIEVPKPTELDITSFFGFEFFELFTDLGEYRVIVETFLDINSYSVYLCKSCGPRLSVNLKTESTIFANRLLDSKSISNNCGNIGLTSEIDLKIFQNFSEIVFQSGIFVENSETDIGIFKTELSNEFVFVWNSCDLLVKHCIGNLDFFGCSASANMSQISFTGCESRNSFFGMNSVLSLSQEFRFDFTSEFGEVQTENLSIFPKFELCSNVNCNIGVPGDLGLVVDAWVLEFKANSGFDASYNFFVFPYVGFFGIDATFDIFIPGRPITFLTELNSCIENTQVVPDSEVQPKRLEFSWDEYPTDIAIEGRGYFGRIQTIFQNQNNTNGNTDLFAPLFFVSEFGIESEHGYFGELGELSEICVGFELIFELEIFQI